MARFRRLAPRYISERTSNASHHQHSRPRSRNFRAKMVRNKSSRVNQRGPLRKDLPDPLWDTNTPLRVISLGYVGSSHKFHEDRFSVEQLAPLLIAVSLLRRKKHPLPIFCFLQSGPLIFLHRPIFFFYICSTGSAGSASFTCWSVTGLCMPRRPTVNYRLLRELVTVLDPRAVKRNRSFRLMQRPWYFTYIHISSQSLSSY